MDGKSLRGTFARAGVHLLAAITHDTATVVGHRQVPVGSSDIACFPLLLDKIDLAGRVVTAGALHATAEHARYLHQRGADTSAHRQAGHTTIAKALRNATRALTLLGIPA